MMRRKFSCSLRLALAAALVLGLGIASGVQAKNEKKPVLTRSSKQAAVIKAAQDILALQPSPAALPSSPTDETKVPHYFGPFPNWANSPFTVPDVSVTINGDGTGATAAAQIGANGALTGINVINPGTGYTTATVSITSATGTGAVAAATVTQSGIVSGITVTAAGAGYTNPSVTFSGGGTFLTQVGNPLVDRAYATDFFSMSPAPVLVVLPAALPSGTLKAFLTRNQAAAAGSPTPSAGHHFNAYLLRPVPGVPNQYGVVLDSGILTVPALANPAVSEVASYTVPSTTVQPGDLIAFYGDGIPVDVGPNTDLFYCPVLAPPSQGTTINLGDATFPLYPQGRAYSFGASIDTSLTQLGNPLIDRAYATDFFSVSPAPVFVVLPTALPAGTLQAFLARNQATTGGSPTPSAGHKFNVFLLRPVTGVPNQYTVVLDSGTLTVPAPASPGVSEVVSYQLPAAAVQAGDLIAFYGEGIPVDVGTGADLFYCPVLAPPAQGGTVNLGNANFPLFPQARTYSFGVTVLQTAASPALSATATAYGSVDVLTLSGGGSGYTMPTIYFDNPADPNGLPATAHVASTALGDPVDGLDANGTITAIVLDSPGSGYSTAPAVVIRDGTIFRPINNGGTGATATASLSIQYITLDTFGSGYYSAPNVTISDPTGTGANATASVTAGGVTSIALTAPGTGYLSAGGMKKFQDTLPLLCDPSVAGSCAAAANNLGQYIPVAVPDTTTFAGNATTPAADYYVIGVVQHRERMSSSLPAAGTLLREYVQLETPANAAWSKHVPLQNQMRDGTSAPALINGQQAYAVDDPHFLGPVIVANKNRPVRIVFYNLLPTGAAGDLFLPTDSTLMGSGPGPSFATDPINQSTVMDEVRNPKCTQYPKDASCFKDNRATLHLHGGITPWISDGTPHQWITPASENTPWPEGVSVGNVPDMSNVAGVPDCSAETDGCQTFYYTNQQSARLMFYHDHAWGITRLNVYSGEAAGYLITDATDQKLIGTSAAPGPLYDVGIGIPLVIQDRTFVPGTQQIAWQDPTWDAGRWGGLGNFWYHHVYMPAQNPGDPGGMSAYGRWMYGPWFWPPAGTAMYGPIPNPYYNPACKLDDSTTWQYQTDPFCEPQLIPGTPNISAGMEQFNDTPLVNGTAYPTTTVEPKAYRLRILNAANDRFWNLQWYVGDPTTASTSLNSKNEIVGPTEVALNPAELAAAQVDPVVVPTALKSIVNATGQIINLEGPDWIQIGTEGGFLPAPVVVDGQQVTTWITDPTRFDVGNVDLHSLLLGPAERADIVVDFSRFAGKTLILYNDAPAAFPARVPSYDYYTGAPDLTPVGAPSTLPGYGPNTRTIMQVKVAAARTDGKPITSFNLLPLQAAFRHHADGSGAFESGQHPIIVGQAGYNSAYGTNFPASSWCNTPGSTSTSCDGFARISEQGGDLFGFNTLIAPNQKLQVRIEPKAIHDEMNASAFDEFGRMQANMGLEVVPATPASQNVVLYPYVNPATELIDGTNLPKIDSSSILSGVDFQVSPISVGNDGTQIWKITHNGVDTHPIHFHLYDVQLLNRVGWDNIIIAPDSTELGWKDTVRISPLQDTIVAVRPVVPSVPFELPNSIRVLHPRLPLGAVSPLFNNMDANGNGTAQITNQLVNFGWEYVWHCHILSHEEMDMMRPVSLALPPIAPNGLAYSVGAGGLNLTWNDNSISETSFLIQKADANGTWVDAGEVQSPLDQPNTHGSRSFTDAAFNPQTDVQYRIVAKNTVGYGGQFMSLTVQSMSSPIAIAPGAPSLAAPSNAAAANGANQGVRRRVNLIWTDNSNNETGFRIEVSTNNVNWALVTTTGANATSFTVTGLSRNTNYYFRIRAVNGALTSPWVHAAPFPILTNP